MLSATLIFLLAEVFAGMPDQSSGVHLSCEKRILKHNTAGLVGPAFQFGTGLAGLVSTGRISMSISEDLLYPCAFSLTAAGFLARPGQSYLALRGHRPAAPLPSTSPLRGFRVRT